MSGGRGAGYIPGLKNGDVRFEREQAKLVKTASKLPKVSLENINIKSFKPWIERRLAELVGFDDEVLVETTANWLEERKQVEAGELQLLLSPFMGEDNAKLFVGELWGWFERARKESDGIAKEFIEDYLFLIKKEKTEEETERRKAFERRRHGHRANNTRTEVIPEQKGRSPIRRYNHRNDERYFSTNTHVSKSNSKSRSRDRSRGRSRSRSRSRRRSESKSRSRSRSKNRGNDDNRDKRGRSKNKNVKSRTRSVSSSYSSDYSSRSRSFDYANSSKRSRPMSSHSRPASHSRAASPHSPPHSPPPSPKSPSSSSSSYSSTPSKDEKEQSCDENQIDEQIRILRDRAKRLMQQQ